MAVRRSGGCLSLRRGRGLLRAPVGRALGRQQAIEAQTGLGGGFDVQQGIMRGEQTIGCWAKRGRVLQGQ